MSRVSANNHIKAITLNNGTEAKIPPHNELRFEISEIAVINIAETIILIMYCNIVSSSVVVKDP